MLRNISPVAGKYRLLCLINDVETERMVKGYCRECGKQDDPDKFDQKDTELLCCSKVIHEINRVAPGFIFNSRLESV